ncbi:MAG: redoxin domain-containing protein [Planctomycetota bacterium]|nr:redoxin domain-containing protein [Planctomycetota bacterium]
MSLSAALLACTVWLANPLDDAPACAVRYSGTLTAGVRNGEGNPVKRFNLYCLVRRKADGRELSWFLTERGAGGWSWPERFGTLEYNGELAVTSGDSPHLLYDYEGAPTVLSVPLPLIAYSGKLKADAKWNLGKESWEVTQQTKLGERLCWQATATTGIGKKRTVWVLTDAPLMAAIEEKVFVGQGDEHRLSMQLEAFEALSNEDIERQTAIWTKLVELQKSLKRKPLEIRPELSDEQLGLVSKVLPELKKLSADTPFSSLVTAVSSDLRGQNDRTSEVNRLQQKFVGKPAPAFELNLLDKSTVSADDLKGQIVVLHFWEYQSEPLVEPYGQVGYLDFLNDRRKKLGVKVFGVAVDERFAQEQSAPAAAKSAQRLKSFMNLGYPLAGDDGKLLKKFGDPRESNAKLPLWVVIGADGKIAHFHAGLYTINADEGLKELDELLIPLIRKARGKAE